MPTQTFWNLSQEKRDILIAVALDEFASYPYQAASLSRIVARVGIAKGSVYQYFRDKRDLFLFLVAHAAARYYALLRADEPPDHCGFFALMRWQMSAGVRVCLREPQLAALLARVRADDLPFRDETLDKVRQAGREHIRAYVERAITAGEIAEGIDPDVATFVLEAVSDWLHASPPVVAPAAGSNVGEDTGAWPDCVAMERIFDAVTRILEHGLGTRVGGLHDAATEPQSAAQGTGEEEPS